MKLIKDIDDLIINIKKSIEDLESGSGKITMEEWEKEKGREKVRLFGVRFCLLKENGRFRVVGADQRLSVHIYWKRKEGLVSGQRVNSLRFPCNNTEKGVWGWIEADQLVLEEQ